MGWWQTQGVFGDFGVDQVEVVVVVDQVEVVVVVDQVEVAGDQAEVVVDDVVVVAVYRPFCNESPFLNVCP